MSHKAVALCVLFVEVFGLIPFSFAFANASPSSSWGAPAPGQPSLLLANGTSISTAALAGRNFDYNYYHLSSCQQGGTFVVGATGDPTDLSGNSQGFANLGITAEIFQTLVHLTPTGVAQPDLAQSWTVSANGTVYTFNLVRNSTWSDGVPVTAEDVYYTMTAVAPALNGFYSGNIGNYVSHWTLVNNYTIQAVLKHPTPDFLWGIGDSRSGLILPAHRYMGTGNLSISPTNIQSVNPVTNGPYVIQQWVRGQSVTLVRNPNYFMAGVPVLDKIVFQEIPNLTTRYEALRAGEINSMVATDPTQEHLIAGAPGIKQVTPPVGFSVSWLVITFNLRRAPFNNTLVRQALAYSFPDQQVLQKVYLNGTTLTAGPNGPFPPGSYAYTNNTTTYPFNLTKAAQLLNQAGYLPKANGTRFEFSLLYRSAGSTPQFGETGPVWANALSQIGVTLITQGVTDAVWLSSIQGGNYNFDAIGFTPGASPDLSFGLFNVVLTSNIKPGNYLNSGGYSNPQVDALAAQVENASTLAQQGPLLDQIIQIVMKDSPLISVGIGGLNPNTYSMTNNVLNFQLTTAYNALRLDLDLTCFGPPGAPQPAFGVVAAAVGGTATQAASSTAVASSESSTASGNSQAAPSSSSSQSGLDPTTLAVIAIAVVIMVGAAGTMMMRSRRSGAAAQPK